MKVTYTLQRGDTLYQIAHFYNTTVAELLALNPHLNPHNLRVGEVIIVKDGETPQTPTLETQLCNLKSSMRKAWIQHVYWAKILLTSVSDRLKDTPDVASRLLQNPVDIVAVFSRFLPQEANQKLTRLLTEHVELCGTIYASMRDGVDTTEMLRAWQVNSDKIATLLATYNPKYNYETLKKMLDNHIQHTLNGATQRLQGNYLQEIQIFNHAETDTLIMSDYLSENLI